MKLHTLLRVMESNQEVYICRRIYTGINIKSSTPREILEEWSTRRILDYPVHKVRYMPGYDVVSIELDPLPYEELMTCISRRAVPMIDEEVK